MSETEPLLENSSRVSGFKKWILLSEFCMLAFLQSSIFLAWNPIANSALKAFGPQWTPSTLAWQINLATISSPFVQYPVWFYLKKFDLSRTIRWLAVFPLVISSLLSSLPILFHVPNEAYEWLTYGSFLFTGVTGVVFFSCVTRFSATWFGPGQTATSTGMACTFANLGGILPSIVGPLMVTDPFRNPTIPIHQIQEEIYKYMLLYLILSLILFTIFWFHFPDNHYVEQPDLNESVKSDVIQILKSGNVIIVILVASLGSIPHIWGSTLLTVTLSRLEIYQNFVGAVTTISLISSTIFTFILTRLADLYFGQNQKNLIMGCMPVHALSMIGLAVCILIGTPQANNQYLIGICYIIAIGVLNSISPLILELASELTHPISEDIIAGAINQANNAVGVIFYLLFSYVPNSDWLLYLLMVVPVVTLVLFSFLKEHYNRRENVQEA